MTFKVLVPIVTITSCLTAAFFSSCGPPVQKQADAFDLVKKERMLSDDSSFVSKEIMQASMKTEAVKKVEIVDEWTRFRLETEKKIKMNEAKIQKIKNLPELKTNLRKKLASLEKDNNNLKSSLEEYQEAIKAKWEAYKSYVNHSAIAIGDELSTINSDK
jgi:uncharacterized protein (DUF1800 family)